VAGVENEGEFIKKKTLYENKVLRLAELTAAWMSLKGKWMRTGIY